MLPRGGGDRGRSIFGLALCTAVETALAGPGIECTSEDVLFRWRWAFLVLCNVQDRLLNACFVRFLGVMDFLVCYIALVLLQSEEVSFRGSGHWAASGLAAT